MVVAQPAGFGEFGGGTLGVSFEAIGRSEEGVHKRQLRNGVACSFEPRDRLVGARLQQIYVPNRAIKMADAGVAGTEPDGLLLKRDYFFYRPSRQLAPCENVQHRCVVAIDRKRR